MESHKVTLRATVFSEGVFQIRGENFFRVRNILGIAVQFSCCIMFKNYLLIALRNSQRQLSYSLINIIGLAIGIACSLVIFLYVYGEWSYDRHFQKGDRIYRIGISFFNIGKFANGPER